MIATAVGRSVAALDAITNLNELYIIDDSAIIPLLREILVSLDPGNGEISNQLVQTTVSRYFAIIHRRVS